MKKIIAILGARPQFIKHAPVSIELNKLFELKSIHTGQHYDHSLSQIFFEELNIQKPDYFLNIGSHSHGAQTGLMLIEIEKILVHEKPDLILVYGDTNSTLAGAIASAKLHIPIAHIEAGLRSFNKEMPEEINRVITDHISTLLFPPTIVAKQNLTNEGIIENVFLAGDVMVDSILLAKSSLKEVQENNFYLVTLHRPYNTDDINRLIEILNAINILNFPIVFPIHPRTKQMLYNNSTNLNEYSNINFIEPQSYINLIKLQMEAIAIITDSGGIQKEAYILKKRCITLRKETEWIETLEGNWNTLLYSSLEEIENVLSLPLSNYIENIYGDGRASFHIAERLKTFLDKI